MLTHSLYFLFTLPNKYHIFMCGHIIILYVFIMVVILFFLRLVKHVDRSLLTSMRSGLGVES